jgi:hypothetical protein
LENPIEVVNHFVIPETDHAIADGAQLSVALLVLRAVRMLAAVKLNDHAPFAAHEVGVIAPDRLLADKFEAAKLPTANLCPQRGLCTREIAPQ